MEYRWMGASGLRVSKLCLGTMTFGHGTDWPEAERMVHMALDAGVVFFDTADSYSAGASEQMLGKALGTRRQEIVLATKFTNATGPGINDSGASRIHIMKAIEQSLRRLQTDYVDIYYIHHVDEHTPLEETLRALDDLVRQGKMRYVACSNLQAWRLCDALWLSQVGHLEKLVCYQGSYSLVIRDLEEDVIPLAMEKGLGLVTFGALAGGFLSGKYEPGQRSLPGTRSEEGWVFHSRFFAPNADETLTTLLGAARENGCQPAAAALAWVLQRPGLTAALIGARTAEQLAVNLRGADVQLDPESLEKLTRVSERQPRYPEVMERGQQARRDAALKMPG